MELLKNRSLWFLAGCWTAGLLLLLRSGKPIEEPIFMLLLFGIVLPGLAWFMCRGLPSLAPAAPRAGEGMALAGLLVFVTAFLAAKGAILEALLPGGADPRHHEIVNTSLKLAVFVGVPLVVYALALGLRPKELGLSWPPPPWTRRVLTAGVVIGAALLAIQIFLGTGARPFLAGEYAGRHWIAGLVLSFVWLSVEAGLVEETFFRIILQSRLAALQRSALSGLFLSSLLFGLAHAPGMYLRGAGAVDGLGDAPSLALAAAYCVTTLSLAGVVFGVLWARTRNWLLIVLLHGLTDMLPNVARFLNIWGL